MTRRVWIPVLVTVAALSVAGLAPRASWSELGAGAARLARGAWPAATVAVTPLGTRAAAVLAPLGARATEQGRHALAAAVPAARAASLALSAFARSPLGGRAAVALAVVAALALGGALAARVRAPRARVLRLARAGRAAAGIARRTGLARDAVRMTLSPDVARRRRAAESAERRPSLPFARGARRAYTLTGTLR
jgi:hypothetical protein